ncbi:hypothetical protein [Micromonospora carbonacea]|uniref:hypothetical protein n=1 Tax=Micromonospora carbonacea TaxID=47853 RepID=UPI0033D67B4F
MDDHDNGGEAEKATTTPIHENVRNIKIHSRLPTLHWPRVRVQHSRNRKSDLSTPKHVESTMRRSLNLEHPPSDKSWIEYDPIDIARDEESP